MAFLAVVGSSSTALGNPLTPEALRVVDRRLERTVERTPRLQIAEGDTVFIERSVEVPAARVRGEPDDFEAIVTGIVAPNGIVVHPRVDTFSIQRVGDKVRISFVYAIHVDPGTSTGGKLRGTLSLVERKGLANLVVKDQMDHQVDVTRHVPTEVEIAADFHGYRHYAQRATVKLQALEARRLRGLSLKDNARLPPLDRVGPRIVALAVDMTRDRRRMWIAHRHLVSATNAPDARIASQARTYLANLDTPDDRLKGLPAVSLTGAPTAVAEAPPPPPPRSSSDTLQPIAEEPATGGGGGGGSGGGSGELAPLGSYEPGTEADTPFEIPRRREADPSEAPPPAPPPPAVAQEPASPPGTIVKLSDDPFGDPALRRVVYITGYGRGLVLDDPNIAHGAAVRMAWASVEITRKAIATAFFYEAQVALTKALGIELTIPTEYVNVDFENARSLYVMGNPLIAAKYRLHLPELEGRRPALTIRARWGIPISPFHSVPPVGDGAEDFTRQAHFADTYAFFLERSDLGLGASLTWQWNILRLGAQLYGDYFLPVEGAADQTKFFTLSYAASVGVLPFEDMVGFYVEARSTSLFAGPGRTEVFTYLGARGRFLDYLEPAIWVGLPLGSVSDVSGLQLGAELRFSYDIYDVLDPVRSNRRDQPLLD